MRTTKELEHFGKFLVESRNFSITMMFRDLFGETRVQEMIEVREALKVSSMSKARQKALRNRVIFMTDYAVAHVIAAMEHQITMEQLQIKVSPDGDVEKQGYVIDGMDPLGAMYHSGEGSWVDKYGDPRDLIE